MQKTTQHAISPTREEDYPEWYQQVLKAADLAENAPVRGCMVIKPWGYAIWENIQRLLDADIKRTGHVNAYFPLLIPLSFLEKEAEHVEGFAKECAVVTHHRLEAKDGKLVPKGELEEPLVIRPTSETMIADCFSRWIESWRDLPLLINQWANIVRWEMRPRIFLRTTEFLWQEGHTAHATEQEAVNETEKMLGVYTDFTQNCLAIPVISGEKSPGERFPGAVKTFTFEMMMQDRKALQGGTSHYLGQNFSKASNIRFSDKEGNLEYPYTTSWGMTTRLIGGLIMVHGDDDGLQLPPRVAPYQVIIIPVVPKEELEEAVFRYAQALASQLQQYQFSGEPLRIHVDTRDRRGGEKNWEWIKKGVPIRIEIGPRDIEKDAAMVARRDRSHREKESFTLNQLPTEIPKILEEIQKGMFKTAETFRDSYITETITTFDELVAYFRPKNLDKPEIHGGFVRAKWCEDPETEELLKEHKLTIRCIPFEQSNTEGKCILTGRAATTDVIISKAY